MLYSSYRGAGGSFRGKTWKLSSGYWRACNYNGQQCTFKAYNEAVTFAAKGKELNEATKFKQVKLQAVRTKPEAEQMAKDISQMPGVTSTHIVDLPNGQFQAVLLMKDDQLQEGRARTHYLPGLNRRMMSDLGGELVKKGYKVKIKGPNLSTDAPEVIIHKVVDDFSTGGGQYDWRVKSKREGGVVREAKSSFTLHAMGNGWSHSKTISANSQKEAEAEFRKDPRFRRQARQAEERWQEVPIVGDREARSKFAKTTKKKVEPPMDRSTFLSRIKGPAQTSPQHYATAPSKRRGR
jgi:hypothetical protein